MIRRYVAAALAAGTLVAAWPAGAAGKGVPASVGVCGPSACVPLSDRATRLAIRRTEGKPSAPEPTLAPYFRLTTRPDLFGFTGYVVPSQGVVVVGSGTYRLGPRVLAVVRARLSAVAPYHPRVGRVWVGGRPAADPSAYAAVLRRPSTATQDANWHAHSMPIAIEIDGATPWAAWDSARYFPASRLLHVPDGACVALAIAAVRHRPRPRLRGA